MFSGTCLSSTSVLDYIVSYRIFFYSRYSASRLGAHIPQFLPIIITYASSEDADDELREICFQSLESFVIRCPTEITPFVDQIIDLALTYLKYDPNYAADEDEVCFVEKADALIEIVSHVF